MAATVKAMIEAETADTTSRRVAKRAEEASHLARGNVAVGWNERANPAEIRMAATFIIVVVEWSWVRFMVLVRIENK
jgi:hypothetical protein